MSSPQDLAPERFDYVQCKATARSTGNRCGRPAVPGATVCRYHGGAAPQVQRKAKLRLLELVDPAVAVLGQIMADRTASPHARIRAAENVLDRAGVPRKVEVTEAETAKQLLIERLIALRDQGPPAPERPEAREIVVGSVVPNDPDDNPIDPEERDPDDD